MLTRRERIRQATIQEIKILSRDIIRLHGIHAVTVNGLAKRMGMTPPAFYSYYKNRDELVRDLVKDAYASFLTHLETARDAKAGKTIDRKIFRVFMAYREWAVDNPNFFALFAGRRVPGINEPKSGVARAAEQVYKLFTDLFLAAWENGRLKEPLPTVPMPDAYLDQLSGISESAAPGLPKGILHQILSMACQVHGMISMELSGRLSVFLGDPGPFYEMRIREMMGGLGMHVDQSIEVGGNFSQKSG